MQRSFFVFSLPRSGSAWLATFLTSRDSYCFHDPLADMPVHKLPERFATRPEETVGAVDTGAFCWPITVRQAMRASVLCVLTREPEAIRLSSAKLGIDFPARKHAAELRAGTEGCLEIRYKELGNIGALRDLWSRLIGTPFDEERAEQLIEMRIERDLERFSARRPHLALRA